MITTFSPHPVPTAPRNTDSTWTQAAENVTCQRPAWPMPAATESALGTDEAVSIAKARNVPTRI
jgi:hypothetical protein